MKANVGKLILIRNATADKTKGGIIIPENAKTKSQECTVKAVHSDSKFKVGQTVVIHAYSGIDVKYKDQDYCVIKEEDILFTVE